MRIASSSNSTFDNHESLGTNHDQAPEAHAPYFDTCSLSAMPP